MNIENVTSFVTTLGGTFFASFLTGYFIKKIIKVMMFIIGGILSLLMYLQSQGMININIDVDKIQKSTDSVINTIMTNTTAIFANDSNPSIIESNLGIPLSGSAASGFMLGLTGRG